MKKIYTMILIMLVTLVVFSMNKVVHAEMIQSHDDQYKYFEGIDLVKVELGYFHSSAITSDNRVYIWGWNDYGQLGIGTSDYDTHSTPIEITNEFGLDEEEKIVDIFLGGYHSAAISSEGRVFTWGDNECGELGDETASNKAVPTEITGTFNLNSGETVVTISLGAYHSSAVTSEGRLFTWGENLNGQVGNGTTNRRYIPTDITSQFNLNEGETITNVSLGSYYSLAITSENRVFGWGYNLFGQLGTGTSSYDAHVVPIDITSRFGLSEGETVIKIIAGDRHASAITSTGKIFIWGYNGYGQVGDGTIDTRKTPVDVTSQFGLNEGETITLLSLGNNHSSALSSEGRLFTWGYGYYGQLGDNSYSNSANSTPIEITDNLKLNRGEKVIDVSLGTSHSGAVTTEGRVFTWGSNSRGQLGYQDINHQSSPIDITSNFSAVKVLENNLPILETITTVSLGKSYSMALTSTGRVFTWGNNDYGQLGNESTLSGNLPIEITARLGLNNSETVVSISLGSSHSAILTSEGRVFTWGRNYEGQLGDGTVSCKDKPIEITNQFNLSAGETIVNISLGYNNSSAISSTGKVFIWGSGTNIPADITSQFSLSAGETITSISLGNSHYIVTTSTGRVFTWGDNSYGQLGDGTLINKTTPTEITNQFSFSLGESLTIISLGYNHSSAVTSTGRVFTWGFNTYGEMGDETNNSKDIPTEITNNFSLATGETITSVVSKYENSAALTSEGKVFIWGNGTITPTNILSSFSLKLNEKIAFISLGYEHFSTITSEGLLFTWGENFYGELGDGTNTNKETPTAIKRNIIDSKSISLTYTEKVNTYSKSFIKISIFPQYDIGDKLKYIEINNIQYNNTQFNVSNGRIDVFIPNNGSLGDILSYTVNSLTFINDEVIIPVNDTTTETLLVEDTFAPVITFDYDYNLYVEEGIGNNSYTAASAVDDTGQSENVVITGTIDWNTPGKYDLTYYSTDILGNSITKIRTVTVLPNISATGTVAENMTFNYFEDEAYSNIINLTHQLIRYNNISYLSDTDNSDYVYSVGTNNILFMFHIDRMLIIVDKAVSFEDSTVPTFDTISSQTIEAGTSNIDWTTYMVNVIDNSNGILTKVEVIDNVDYDTVGTYTVTVKLIDESLNETSQEFNVDVEDTTSPSFNIINQTIEAGQYTTLEGLITDIVENSDDNLVYSVPGVQLDYDTVGIYTVTVRLSDLSGNYHEEEVTITVEDTTNPLFTTIVNQTIEIGTPNIDWATFIINATDNSNGILTKVEVIDNVDYDTVGTYTVTVKLIDESLNEISQEFNVSVEDTVLPVVLLNPCLDSIEEGTPYIDSGVVVTDLSGTTLIVDNTLDTNTVGVYSITYEVTDNSGNTTIAVRYVTVYAKEPIVEFTLSEANTTIKVNDEYLDGTCSVRINGTSNQCNVKDNNVDITTSGIYTVTYSYNYNGIEYTYKRYVFVYDSSSVLTLYYNFKEEEVTIV